MGKALELTGTQFGEWTVIELDHVDSNGSTYWKCECSCGTEKVIRGSALVQGRTKKCKSCSSSETGKSNRKDDFHVASGTVMQQYIRNAKTRGLDFELTKDQVKELISQNCHYCGNPPMNTVRTFGGKVSETRSVRYNGIDRVDSSKGYTTDNCVPCCPICNYAKQDMSTEQFKEWVKRIYVNQYKKVTDKTPGELIDSLITADIKCFMAQERLMDTTLTESQRLDVAIKTQELNAKRNKLMRSIDTVLGFFDDTVTSKTYSEKFEPVPLTEKSE